MKRRILWVLVILAVGLLSTNVLKGIPQDKDNFGKVIGWVVNPETGKPVEEVFIVKFLKCDESDPYTTRPLASGRTDEKGYFSSELKPNIYCVIFQPESRNSRYCSEPHLYLDEKHKFIIEVEKGKVTEFRKKAIIGGSLRLKLMDTKGRMIDPEAEFGQSGRIIVSAKSPSMPSGVNWITEYSNGEMEMHGLYPDTYSIIVNFQGFGIGRKQKENITVEKGKISEVEIQTS